MPPKPKTEQQRLEFRTAILDAARELFIERGTESVTMREIARRINYSATAIYSHFKDKEALISALCDTDFLALADELQSIENVSDPLQRLRLLGQSYIHFAVTHPNHYRLMFMTPQLQKNPGSSSIEVGNPKQDAYASLRAIVLEAYAAECFRPDLNDAELIAQTLWAGLHGLCALEITRNSDRWITWRNFELRTALMQEVLVLGLLKSPTNSINRSI